MLKPVNSNFLSRNNRNKTKTSVPTSTMGSKPTNTVCVKICEKLRTLLKLSIFSMVRVLISLVECGLFPFPSPEVLREKWKIINNEVG
mmetsp:Transcript_24729/g.56897  ORF Transcript_24729/g.56897 Transcript_24729/m.56897 type:complete len:88 (+) Transcript_24729:378-641(+)